MGLISRQKLKKITEKNGTFFFENGKERNVPNGKERGAQPWSWPTLETLWLVLAYLGIIMVGLGLPWEHNGWSWPTL